MPQKVTWEDINATGNALLSPAYKSNGHVFTSGQVGVDASGKLGDGVTAQTELAILNLKKVLEVSGSSLDKVLKVLLFIKNREDAAAVNAVYKKYFTTQPGRSCIIVDFPNPEILVELECTAEYEEIPSKL